MASHIFKSCHRHVTVVLRAPMRSRDDGVDASRSVQRALDEGLCGMGGRLATPPASLDEALLALEAEHDERTARRLERFASVPDDSFAWTRLDGAHHLGRLTGPWKYDATAAAQEVDLVHVRPCPWVAVDPALVPAAVLHTFARGGRNVQAIHTDGVEADTERAWELTRA